MKSNAYVAAVPQLRAGKSSRRWLRAMQCMVVLAVVTAAVPAYAQAISPRRLVELSELGNPAISPDGQRVAFRIEQASIERNTYDSTWYVQDLKEGSRPHRISDGGVPLREHVNGLALPSLAVWSPNGRWLYYRARIGGRTSVWRAAADGSGASEITSDAADVRAFELSADGLTLRYSVGATRAEVIAAEDAEYDLGVRIDETVMIAGGLVRSSVLEDRPATQRFVGDWYTPGPLLAETEDRWKAVDLAAMTTREISSEDVVAASSMVPDMPPGTPQPRSVVSHPSGGRVAVVLPGPETGEGLMQPLDAELAVMVRRGRAMRLERCTASLCRGLLIQRAQWRPDSDELLFTVIEHRDGRAQSIHAWNVVTGAVRPVVMSDGLVNGGVRHWDMPCALSAQTLVCVAAEADRPPRLEAINVDSGQRRVLFAPNEGLERDIAATVSASSLRWTDERGRVFTGKLFEAPIGSDGPPPLFVTFYTCHGFLRGGLGDEWPLASLAQAGISALCIDALPGYRRDPVDRYEQGRLAVEGVVDRLAGEGRIDRTRVGMGGLSFGSEVTMWTLAYSDVVAVASVASTAATPSAYLFNSLRDAYVTGLDTMWQLGAPDETPERWKEISPVFHLDRIRAPILFQLPEQEYRMLLGYALPLIRRRQGELYVFPDEAHIKFQPRHKLVAYQRNLDWFRFWLQGYEDSDPSKIPQYRFWREMNGHPGAIVGPVDQVSNRP